jgi:hypothetical protein
MKHPVNTYLISFFDEHNSKVDVQLSPIQTYQGAVDAGYELVRDKDNPFKSFTVTRVLYESDT